MCEHETIRYVFTMQHLLWSDKLRCGCCCAGWMLGDSIESRDIERCIKNAVNRHKTHLNNLVKMRADYVADQQLTFGRRLREVAQYRSQPWRLTSGNNYGIYQPRVMHVLVLRAGSGWKFRVKLIFKDDAYWDNTIFPTLEEAQRAALNYAYPDPKNVDLSDAALDMLFKPDPRPTMSRAEWEQRRDRERALDSGWTERVHP